MAQQFINILIWKAFHIIISSIASLWRSRGISFLCAQRKTNQLSESLSLEKAQPGRHRTGSHAGIGSRASAEQFLLLSFFLCFFSPAPTFPLFLFCPLNWSIFLPNTRAKAKKGGGVGAIKCSLLCGGPFHYLQLSTFTLTSGRLGVIRIILETEAILQGRRRVPKRWFIVFHTWELWHWGDFLRSY